MNHDCLLPLAATPQSKLPLVPIKRVFVLKETGNADSVSGPSSQ